MSASVDLGFEAQRPPGPTAPCEQLALGDRPPLGDASVQHQEQRHRCQNVAVDWRAGRLLQPREPLGEADDDARTASNPQIVATGVPASPLWIRVVCGAC